MMTSRSGRGTPCPRGLMQCWKIMHVFSSRCPTRAPFHLFFFCVLPPPTELECGTATRKDPSMSTGTSSLSQGASSFGQGLPIHPSAQSHTHLFIHFGHASQPTMHVFGLGEETPPNETTVPHS
ncbi:hypothetical protein AMELA_G00175130 [Ameiurus melas]|uniref:Uncharacterized protein n=1 Tax=Ameiurus melas TaxID=219545 RepID=A0A7J6AH29_AMEME|nr:hypothetical protein AMELA_G00175130 [Ameiurus melas]